MNLFRVTITVLLTAAAESASGRTLHWGQHNQDGQGGRGKDILAKLQGMVDTECNSDFVCPESVTGCDEVIDKPERPLLTWWNMSEEEKAEAKAEMEAKKDAFKEQVLTCACCDGKTVEELVGYDEDGQGGRGKDILAKLQGMVDTECNSEFLCPESVTGCDEVIDKPERPLLTSWWNMSEEEKAEAKAEMEAKKDAFKEQVLTCACCDGKTVEELVGNDRISDYDEDGSESSLDEDGSESNSSSKDDSSEESIGENTDLTSLPGQATSIARASAAVDGFNMSNAAGQAGISWAFVFAAAAFGIASWAS